MMYSNELTDNYVFFPALPFYISRKHEHYLEEREKLVQPSDLLPGGRTGRNGRGQNLDGFSSHHHQVAPLQAQVGQFSQELREGCLLGLQVRRWQHLRCYQRSPM